MNKANEITSRQEDHLQRRLAIIAAAAQVFLQSGFDSASMLKIAKNAGVSKQTLYSHFGSKEALFMEAITSTCRKYTPEGLESVANMSLEDTLKSIGRSLCELILSEEAIRLESLCIAGANKHAEVSEMYWQAGPEWVRKFLIDCFQTQVDNGHLVIEDTELAARQFTSLLFADKKSKLLLGLEKISNEEISEIVDQAVSFFLSAVQPNR